MDAALAHLLNLCPAERPAILARSARRRRTNTGPGSGRHARRWSSAWKDSPPRASSGRSGSRTSTTSSSGEQIRSVPTRSRATFGEPTQPELARAWGVDEPVAYQFGLPLPWSLFYAIGKPVAAAGLETIGGYPAGVAAIALAISAPVAVTCVLLVPVLRWLGLGHGGFALSLGVFGTPLFYYGSFATGMSHVP